MELLNFNFSEMLGLFLGFAIFVYFIIALFVNFMRIFEGLYGDKIDRIFHYHYHYRDRRK